MRPGRLFWGTFLVATGVLLLLERADVLPIDLHWYWRLWPLILVFWGISAVAGNRMVSALLAIPSALLLGSLLVGLVNFSWIDAPVSDETIIQNLVEPYDRDIERASLTVDAIAGTYVIEQWTPDLIDATLSSRFGSWRLERQNSETSERLRLTTDHPRFRGGGRKSRAEIRLNTAPVWELNLDAGAARLDLDLRNHRVETLRIDAGASEVRVKLGRALDETRVQIEAGVSSIRISVPEEAGCEIRTEVTLASRSFSGFASEGHGMYRTDNFQTSSTKIYMDIDAGVSSVRVTRD